MNTRLPVGVFVLSSDSIEVGRDNYSPAYVTRVDMSAGVQRPPDQAIRGWSTNTDAGREC